MTYFNSSHKSWSSYSERLGYYFAANDVQDEDKKKAILLTVWGPSTFQLLKSLLWPGTPADKWYSKLVEVLGKHFNPAQSVIMQSFKFNTWARKESESVATYVAELKRLGEHCEFGENFNEMVRDWLVCGVNDLRIQNRLLQESTLTFTKAFKIAQSVEAAAKDAAGLQNSFQFLHHQYNICRVSSTLLTVVELTTLQIFVVSRVQNAEVRPPSTF